MQWRHPLQQFLILGIFIQSLVATVGSLYYQFYGDIVTNLVTGQVLPVGQGFEPCLLCWWARILMYPLVLISYVGLLRKDSSVHWYILPASVMGIALESYHYYLQKFPNTVNFTCTANNPCDGMYVNYWGIVTIPFLCLTAFVIITILAMANAYLDKKATKEYHV